MTAKTAPWVTLAADLALGLSLGLYYTITYYGRSLLPLPGAVALGAPLMYYMAVDGEYSTVIQAWLWMICFPLAGVLWRLAVVIVPRFASAECRTARLSFRPVAARLGLACWPLLLPLPALAVYVGRPEGAWRWADFVAVCLRHRNVDVPSYLPAVMMALAVAACVLEVSAVWRLLPGEDRLRKAAVLALTCVFLVASVVLVGLGLALARPFIIS